MITPQPPNPPDHAWIHEHLAAALTAGLSPADQSRFDAHINTCPDCFDAFTEARDADRSLQRALSALSPASQFEEQLLETLREKTMHKSFRPIIKRAAMAIAAAVALAATGVFAQYAVNHDSLTQPLANPLTNKLLASAQSRGITLPFLSHDSSVDAPREIANRSQYAAARLQATSNSLIGLDSPLSGRPGFARSAREIQAGQQQNFVSNFNQTIGGGFGGGGGQPLLGQDRSGALTRGRVLKSPAEPNGKVVTQTGYLGSRDFEDEAIKDQSKEIQKLTPERAQEESRPKLDLTFGVHAPSHAAIKEAITPPAFNLADITKAPPADTFGRTTTATRNDNVEHLTPAPFDIAMVPTAEVAARDRESGEPSPKQFIQKNDPATPESPPAPSATEVAQRKIIRNGEVEFEVRSFDDASATIAAVVTEEAGFVSSTSSEKLANGKVKGTVIVRVPPEHLDRTLLKLRALGDLKTQQISANDVTKQYTDIDSELRALRAMESRLIDLIKTGKGEVKDLVVAEKQLGEYRVRIEKLEGDLRYYNNLVGMATLSIVASEKDIQKPTAASEQEDISLALETDDVETRYNDARKILDDAKARIVESELKKYEADQYSARIVVDIPPDKADFVTAQLKQIGKVANYNRDRKQTTTGGTGVPTVQVEQKDARLILTLYNLATVPPRETTVITLAVPDVEAAYRKILSLVRQTPARSPLSPQSPVLIPQSSPLSPQSSVLSPSPSLLSTPSGRILTSNINGQQPLQMAADINAEIKTEASDALLQAVRSSGEVLASTVSENADTASTTSAKRGLRLHLVNIAGVPPRETRSLRAVAANVPDAYTKLLAALQTSPALSPAVRIVNSHFTETDPRSISAGLSFDVQRTALPLVDKAFADAGIDFLSRNIVRSSDTVNTLDSRVFFQIDELVSADALPPRRTTTLGLEVDSVEKSLDSLRSALSAENVKEIEFNLAKDSAGRVTGHLVIETPTANAMTVLTRIKDLGGNEKINQVVKNTQVPDAPFARERIDLTLANKEALVESGKGLAATLRAALGSSATALLYSLYLILTGILFVGPFLILAWILYKLARRRRPAPSSS